MLDLVIKMIQDIVDNSELLLDRDTKFQNIKYWDSLNTVDLELAIESEFDISFETGEFQTYKTIDELIKDIEKKRREN